MDNFRDRVLEMTNELAMTLVWEYFTPGRIAKMIKSGEITSDEIVAEFKKNLEQVLEEEEANA